MYRFLGMQNYDFISEKNNQLVQGYTLWFSDTSKKKGYIGEYPFKKSCNYENAARFLNIFTPADMESFVPYIGESCKLAFGRTGNMIGIKIGDLELDVSAFFDGDVN